MNTNTDSTLFNGCDGDEFRCYDAIIGKVKDGARFSVDFSKRTLRLNGKTVDLHRVKFGAIDLVFVMRDIETLYAEYKHSVPSERSESRRKRYFKALPEEKLSDDDMLYGQPREVARARLELKVLFYILGGNLRWGEKWGSWFWQSSADKDLVILRSWIEP